MKIQSITKGGSEFGLELTKLFEKLEARRDSFSAASDRINKCVEEAIKLAPQFTKLILKHTGVKLTGINFHASVNGNISILILIGTDLTDIHTKYGNNRTIDDYKKNRYWPITIANHAYGNDLSELFVPDDYTKEELKDLKKLSDSYDKKMSKLKPGTMFKDKPISGLLNFDLGCTMLARECIGKQASAATPAECAAVLLHEIGHVLSLCKVAADQYFKLAHFNSLVKHIAETDRFTKEDKLEIIVANLDDEKEKEVATDIIRGGWNTTLSVIGKILFTLGIAVVSEYVILITLVGYLSNIIAGILVRPFHKLYSISGRKYKTGDIGRSYYNNYFQEWDADAYVAEHGLGSYVATALYKLTDNFKLLGISWNVDSKFDYYRSKILFYLMYSWVYTWGHFMEDSEVHGSTSQRALNIMKIDISRLKNDNLTPEGMKLLVEDYYRAEKVYKNFDGKDVIQGMMYGSKWILYAIIRIVTTPLGLDSLRDSTNTITKMKNVYSELTNNKLFLKMAEQQIDNK